jgi:MSHA pilin protein MshD
MWNRTQAGTTLVELVIAMVIITVGVGGILVVFNTTTRSSADPLLQKQLIAVAEGMMEEIQRMPFAPASNDPVLGCARDNFNDVSDYNGYHSDDACDVMGNIQLAGYSVDVNLVPDTSGDFTGVPAADIWQITVTVANAGATVQLVGWRTNYAKSIP